MQGPDTVLRVLIANERADRLETLAAIVEGLGHVVVGRELRIVEAGRATAELHPEVALVGLGESTQHALELIKRIVGESECPVIAVLPESDASFVREAAKRGIFAYVVEAGPESLASAIDIVLLRFAEHHGLEGAFGRRAVTERAKGILMERHGIDEREAFGALRGYARSHNKKLTDIANAVVAGHLLLPRR